MRKSKPGPQGLANLQTWRMPFSSDVKRRKRQTHDDRRPHKMRGGRPDSVLGTPEMHWTEPPRLLKSGVALNATPKRRGKPEHEPVFFARKVRRFRRRPARAVKKRA